MDIKTFTVKALSKVYKKVIRRHYYDFHEGTIWERQAANDLVFDAVNQGKPLMLSRYGSIEMSVANTIRIRDEKRFYISKIWDYITDKTDLPWLDEAFFLPISRNAGVFNPTNEILERFAYLYLEDSKLADIIMSVNYKEKFMPLSSDCKFIHFESIYPFFVERPWTCALKGKRVLVIYPFDESIKKQYSHKELLFENKDILPDFELLVYRPVQSAAFEGVSYKDWFEALEKMKNDISNLDFDVAILGCGAYGLPLAAHIKRLGKQAIHMGGGTQLLFGIIGSRWENYQWGHNTPFRLDVDYAKLFNEYWVRPSQNETPQKADSVEGACYW